MRRRLLSTILIMAMIFGASVSVYAEAWTSNEAQNVTNDVSDIQEDINNLTDYFYDFWATANGSNAPTLYSWQDFMYEFWRLSEFLIPRGSYEGQTNLWQIIEGTLPNILTYVSSWMSTNTSLLNTNNTYLSHLQSGLTNAWRYANSPTWTEALKREYGQSALLNDSGLVYQWMIGPNGTQQTGNSDYYFRWGWGTPLGNIALMLKTVQYNQLYGYRYLWSAALTDYTGQLGIWDSQGETLTQEGWSPTSAINGLYKYLAYTQRDIARLTYVLASDEEITAREKARENQEAVLNDFVDPDGSGSVSASNFGDIASASDSFKDNMNTGVSASGIFDVFTGDHTNEWFSEETANELNNVGSGSRSLKAATPQPTYETPLLDAKMTELLGIFGGDGE